MKVRVIIAGSRTITDLSLIQIAVDESGFQISEVVCGGARGVDNLGRKWAGNGNRLPVKLFPADWNTYGKRAGYLRNAQMADYADALIAVWDGKSRGTRHMIDIARSKGLAVYIKTIGEQGVSEGCVDIHTPKIPNELYTHPTPGKRGHQ